ncbi:MAG TPA: HWE histidine kinase domain-containing protein [Xanthobacteraceae bacterium]
MDVHITSALQQFLHLLKTTTLDAVVVMDARGVVSDWNEQATSTFGYTEEEATGRPLAELIIPPRYRAAHHAGLAKFLETHEGPLLGRRIEVAALRKSGEEFPVELTISPIAEAGEWIFVGSLRDQSEQKRAERFREQQAVKAEVLYRIVTFAAESGSFEEALALCLESIHRLTGWPVGHIYLPTEQEPTVLLPSEVWHLSDPVRFAPLREASARAYLSPGDGLPGRVWQSGEPLWIADLASDPVFLRREAALAAGVRSAVLFPIVSQGRMIAIVEFFTELRTEYDPDLALTLRAIADQVGRVFERRQAEHARRELYAQAQAELQERRKAEEQLRLLLAELNHRVKNMLAVVTGIAAQTARNSRSIAAFSEKFMARLASLGRAHTLLTARNWQSTPLNRLMEELLAPYAEPEDGHVSIAGPRVSLLPKSALAMSMILHELVTNATKFGALSVPEGRLAVEWSVVPGDPDRVRLNWRETGLQGLAKPRRTGFGTRMIEASVRHELGGTVAVTYAPVGIRYELEFPANQ